MIAIPVEQSSITYEDTSKEGNGTVPGKRTMDDTFDTEER